MFAAPTKTREQMKASYDAHHSDFDYLLVTYSALDLQSSSKLQMSAPFVFRLRNLDQL
jgi:hypothetical protein